MSIAKNIRDLRERRGLTQQQLGEIAGVSDKAVSTWESGTNMPRIGAIQRIADHFGFPKSLLLDDNASYFRDSNPNWSTPLVEAYATATTPKQEAVCTVLDLPHIAPVDVMEPEADNVLFYDFTKSEQSASAGTGIHLDEEAMTTIRVREDALPSDYERCPDRYFGVPVGGNSMEPLYSDGDVLIVSKEPVNIGEVGVFTMEGEGYVKELGRGVLCSLNPEYDDIPLTEDIRCNGKVVGVLDSDDVAEW